MRVFYQPVLSILFALIICGSSASAQTYTVIHVFTGGDDGGSPQFAGLTLGGRGTLYGTTVGGGVAGMGVVFQITHEASGWVLASLLSFPGGTTGTDSQAPVVFGPGGLLYGSTVYGGRGRESCFNGCGVVFTLQPPLTACHAVLCNWIGKPIYQFASLTDGWGPWGNLAFDQAGNVYGTTVYGGTGSCYGQGCGTVFQLTRSGNTWTKTTLYNFNSGNVVGPDSGVIVDRSGVLYGTTQYGGLFSRGSVFQLTPSGSGWTFTNIYNFHNGLNGISDGGFPAGGLVMDAVGNLYGTTSTGGTGGGGTVFELSPAGGGWTLSTIANLSGVGVGGPMGNLAFDSAGNLYGTTELDGAYQYGNVFKLTPSDGQWTYTDLYDFTGGNDGGRPFAGPTVDSSGNIFGTSSLGPQQGCQIHGGSCGLVWEITP